MNVRRMCGFCVDDQIVIVPLPGSKCATTPRGSIAVGASRWFTMRCEMTTSAFANAASIAESSTAPDALTPVPLGTSATARLFGKVRMNHRRLPRHRLFEIDDGRQRVVGTTIASAASRATYRSRGDDDRDRLAGVAHRVDRDGAMIGRRKRRADRHRCEEFGDLRAGKHRLDAVHRLRGAGVDRADASVRDVAPFERQMLHADEGDVVDVGASALDETRVLAPLDALAHELRQTGVIGIGYLFSPRRAEWR